MIAYAFRSGHIGFGDRVPDGALFIANGPKREAAGESRFGLPGGGTNL